MGTTAALAQALRSIVKLEADRRRVTRSLERCTPGSALAGELARQRDELDQRLAHWRRYVGQAEAEGLKVWSREDFSRGDFVRYRGVLWEVLRVNPRSVTVPRAPVGCALNVVRAADVDPEWTWTIGYYDGISGRVDAREVPGATESQGPKNHPE